MIFLLLKFVITLKIYEALLLSLIITISILIIENLIYINNNATDPLNCDQCKISTIESDNTENISNPSQTTQPLEEQKETFISGTIESLINNISSKISPEKINTLKYSDNDLYEFKCIRVKKNNKNENDSELKNDIIEKINTIGTNIKKLEIENENLNENIHKIINENIDNQNNQNNQNNSENSIIEGFENINKLDNFISEQQNINNNLTNKKINPNVQQVKNTNNNIKQLEQNENNNLTNKKINPNIQQVKNSNNNIKQLEQLEQLKQNENKNKLIKNELIKKNEIEMIDKSLEYPYLDRAGLLKDENIIEQTENKSENPITYDVGYVQYQTDGIQKEENNISYENKLFKLDVGEPNIVRPYMNDGKEYYNRIKSYSSSSPTANEALTNELKYGDYNYIGPLNKGMSNSDYTFVTPDNWYPIAPHPPVCVTNRTCTTSPILMSDGKDYMSWASLADFDNARRFTGNMGINIDYVKNVLNNDNGY